MVFGIEAREWLARLVGVSPQDIGMTRMKGSTSSSVFLIECPSASVLQRFVLRVLDNAAWLADEPDLAAHEAAALDEAQRAGIRAPSVVAHSTKEVGFGAPVVLMSFIPGKIALQPADFQGWIEALAGELAAIHRHAANDFAWRYRSWTDKTALAVPPWTAIPRAWERAIELGLRPEPEAKQVFIHRDYHPTNVLWHDGAVTGVVDWINACRGPAGVDVAHCRSNLATMYGAEAAEQFLAAYLEVAEGFEYDPYWDLDTLLDALPRPGYYPPWQEFGLEMLPQETLDRRADAYLECVLLRT